MGDPDRFITDLLLLTPESDLIVLAGDITVLAHGADYLIRFLKKLSLKGRVLFVPGNHEFYGRSFECGEESLNFIKEGLKKYKEIHVNTGSPEWIKYGDFNFLVGTAWFPNLMYSDTEKSWLSDFRVKNLESYIYRYNQYFENLLEKIDKKNIVTVSHHSPTFKSTHPKYAGSSLNRFFCNDWDDLLAKKRSYCLAMGTCMTR